MWREVAVGVIEAAITNSPGHQYTTYRYSCCMYRSGVIVAYQGVWGKSYKAWFSFFFSKTKVSGNLPGVCGEADQCGAVNVITALWQSDNLPVCLSALGKCSGILNVAQQTWLWVGNSVCMGVQYDGVQVLKASLFFIYGCVIFHFFYIWWISSKCLKHTLLLWRVRLQQFSIKGMVPILFKSILM